MWLCKTSSNSFIRVKYDYYYYCYHYYYYHYYYYTVGQSCQRLLNNRVSDSSRSKCFRDNVCSEIPFRVSSYHMKCSQLTTIRDKLAGFSTARFLLKYIYEQTVVYAQKCFSVETCTLQKPVNWFTMQMNWLVPI